MNRSTRIVFIGSGGALRKQSVRYSLLLCAAVVATACANAQEQTYKIGSGSPPPAQKPKSRSKQAPAQSSETTEKNLGWGSNIQNARLARAAENALKNHNYSAAVDFAQRAAQS